MFSLALLAWSPFDPWHLLVIGGVALLLFGKRLPEVGRSLGRGIMEFKKGLKDVQDEMSRDDADRQQENIRKQEREEQERRRRLADTRPTPLDDERVARESRESVETRREP